MTSTSLRLYLCGGVIIASLSLGACSPPNQKTSEAQVDSSRGSVSLTTQAATPRTATPQVAGSADPGYIDCVSAPMHEPTEISLDCIADSDTLTNVVWSSWSAESATGTAQRIFSYTTGQSQATEVSVELSMPIATAQGEAFSQLSVDGEIFTP